VIELTAIRLDGGEDHEHISELLWASGSATGVASRQALIDWLNASRTNQAVLSNGTGHLPVLVVERAAGAAYVRAYAEGRWRDELLELPHF
jgi:hypothetical protein